MSYFRNVIIGDLDAVCNGKPLLPKCYFCHAEAWYLLSRTSNLSDMTYHDPVCRVCKKKWEEAPKD